MLREGERATKMVKIGMWWCINIIWLKGRDCWTPFLHKLNTHFMTHSENGLIVFIFSLFCHFMTFNDIKKKETRSESATWEINDTHTQHFHTTTMTNKKFYLAELDWEKCIVILFADLFIHFDHHSYHIHIHIWKICENQNRCTNNNKYKHWLRAPKM